MDYEYCDCYCGVACVDGTCVAMHEETNLSRADCKYCICYHGCEDCYFNGNPDAPCPYPDRLARFESNLAGSSG